MSKTVKVQTPAKVFHLSETAFAFVEYLLEYQYKHKHDRRTYSPGIVKKLALSYREFTQKVGKGHHRHCGPQLYEVHLLCEANRWPPLNALVIRQAAKRSKNLQGPGHGYPEYDGFKTNAALDAYACLTFDYPPNAVRRISP